MDSGSFLCGCHPEAKRGYSGNMVPGPLGDPIYTDKRFDDAGFEVCPEHGERMYGSTSASSPCGHYVSTGDGRPATFVAPSGKPLKKSLGSSSMDDRRDNRDPVEVGASIKGKGNGHGMNDPEIPAGLNGWPSGYKW